jgi:hypothetical protein
MARACSKNAAACASWPRDRALSDVGLRFNLNCSAELTGCGENASGSLITQWGIFLPST